MANLDLHKEIFTNWVYHVSKFGWAEDYPPLKYIPLNWHERNATGTTQPNSGKYLPSLKLIRYLPEHCLRYSPPGTESPNE